MTRDFITLGIEDDRWLKAERLSDRFISELQGKLERVGEEIVHQNESLFPRKVSGRWKHDSDAGSTIAFARIQYRMNRVNDNEPNPDPLRFNLGIVWVDPSRVGMTSDGTACLARYKIKNDPESDFQEVARLTRADDTPVQIGSDVYRGANGIFYIPISDDFTVTNALEILRNHFNTYGHHFGREPAQ